MDSQILLEKKCCCLEEVLRRNLAKKHSVEVKIREQLEELKKLQISMEKSQVCAENQLLGTCYTLSRTTE